jgi:hypothetical protein
MIIVVEFGMQIHVAVACASQPRLQVPHRREYQMLNLVELIKDCQ